MLKNLHIGVRLGIGLGFVLLLLMVLILALLDDPAKPQGLRQGIEKNRVENKEALDKLDPMINTQKGRELFTAVSQARSALNEKYATYYELLSKDPKAAKEFLLGQFASSNTAYIKTLNDMSEFLMCQIEERARKAEADYASTRTWMFGIGAVALLLAFGFSLWVTRSITPPLNEAVDVADQLAAGDLTARIEVTSRDETWQLLSAMQNMVDKLSQNIGDVCSAADALSSASGEVSATAQSPSQATNEQAVSVEQTSACFGKPSATAAVPVASLIG